MPPEVAGQVFLIWTSNATPGPALRFPIGLADGRHLGTRNQRLNDRKGSTAEMPPASEGGISRQVQKQVVLGAFVNPMSRPSLTLAWHIVRKSAGRRRTAWTACGALAGWFGRAGLVDIGRHWRWTALALAGNRAAGIAGGDLVPGLAVGAIASTGFIGAIGRLGCRRHGHFLLAHSYGTNAAKPRRVSR